MTRGIVGILGARPLVGMVAFAGLAALTVNVGCGDSGTGGGAVDCSTVTVKGYAELQNGAFTKCTNCHSSALTTPTERQSATAGYDYDTYEGAKKFPDRIEARVEKGDMPPAGSAALTAAEADDLINWSACGTPP